MTTIIEFTTAAALVLSIIIPGGAFLLGGRDEAVFSPVGVDSLGGWLFSLAHCW